MRLIDADALRASAIKATGNTELAFDNCFPYWQFSKCIKEAPTINAVPVVRGEWMPAKDPYDRVYCYRHAGCGCEHNEQSAFCPACGAKMESEGNQ